jgi:hypothetical protein
MMNRRTLIGSLPAALALAAVPGRVGATVAAQDAPGVLETIRESSDTWHTRPPSLMIHEFDPSKEVMTLPSNGTPWIDYASRLEKGEQTIRFEVVREDVLRLWVYARLIDAPAHPLQQIDAALLYKNGIGSAVGTRFAFHGVVVGYHGDPADQLSYGQVKGVDTWMRPE